MSHAPGDMFICAHEATPARHSRLVSTGCFQDLISLSSGAARILNCLLCSWFDSIGSAPQTGVPQKESNMYPALCSCSHGVLLYLQKNKNRTLPILLATS